jgi:hypothetical protein
MILLAQLLVLEDRIYLEIEQLTDTDPEDHQKLIENLAQLPTIESEKLAPNL